MDFHTHGKHLHPLLKTRTVDKTPLHMTYKILLLRKANNRY